MSEWVVYISRTNGGMHYPTTGLDHGKETANHVLHRPEWFPQGLNKGAGSYDI